MAAEEKNAAQGEIVLFASWDEKEEEDEDGWEDEGSWGEMEDVREGRQEDQSTKRARSKDTEEEKEFSEKRMRFGEDIPAERVNEDNDDDDIKDTTDDMPGERSKFLQNIMLHDPALEEPRSTFLPSWLERYLRPMWGFQVKIDGLKI